MNLLRSIDRHVTHHACTRLVSLSLFTRLLKRAIARSTPSVKITSTASAARIERLIQHAAVALGIGDKHKSCEILDRMIRLNAKPYASELLSAQAASMIDFSPFCPPALPRGLHANHSERQRYLVTRNDQIRGVALAVTIEKRPYRIAAQIHEGLRFCQQYLLPASVTSATFAPDFVAKTASACALKQSVNEHEPEIMPGHFILSPGIPEPDY